MSDLLNKSNTNRNYCFASTGIVPIRREPSDASEMMTQMILGETATVLQSTDRWAKIRCDQDAYTGWVNKNQIGFLAQNEYESWINDSRRQRSPFFTFFAKNDSIAIMIPVSAYVIIDGNHVIMPHGSFKIVDKPRNLRESDLIDTAQNLLGVSYLWGGRTDNGLDCSGFVQTVHLLHGYNLPRDSKDQLTFTELKSNDINDAVRGDLIFFNTKGNQVNHVGIYLGDGSLLHASGYVRLNNILYDRRKSHPYSFDKRLADHIYGIQSGLVLLKLAKPVQIK